MSPRGITFHLPAAIVKDPEADLKPFYKALIAGLDARGIDTALSPHGHRNPLKVIDEDDRFHVFDHGQVTHPRALNAGVAYIYPFWNMDPKGIRAFSSIADKTFRPARIDEALARAFFGDLRRRLVGKRKSRYEQPEDKAEDLPDAAIAVFLQDEHHRMTGETCYMDRWTMLDTVLEAAEGAPVIVKPHPKDIDESTFAQLVKLRGKHPALVISPANIHDILARARLVVTINSAVGVEAYLHRRPVVLCGQSDFHHIATVAQTPAALAEAVRSDQKGRPYARYMTWYFRNHCLSTTEPKLVDRFLRRVNRMGYEIG